MNIAVKGFTVIIDYHLSFQDIKSGYFVNVNDQVKQVCDEIKNDAKLQRGYNAIGLSQGGQFL